MSMENGDSQKQSSHNFPKFLYWMYVIFLGGWAIEPLRLLLVFCVKKAAILFSYIMSHFFSLATSFLVLYPACVGILSIPIGFVFGGFSFDEYRQFYQDIGGTPLDLYGFFWVLGLFFPIFAKGLGETLPDAVGAVLEVKDSIQDQAMSKQPAEDAINTPEKPSRKKEGKDDRSRAASLSVIKYLLFAPGYITLAIAYFFPNESFGKKRNVASSGRQWKQRDFFAALNAVIIYCVIYFFFAGEVAT
jgi:uncharacterized membrane protein